MGLFIKGYNCYKGFELFYLLQGSNSGSNSNSNSNSVKSKQGVNALEKGGFISSQGEKEDSDVLTATMFLCTEKIGGNQCVQQFPDFTIHSKTQRKIKTFAM